MQDAVSTRGLLVTGNYFELLGARPALGRLLRPDDAAARGGRAVVVLSHQTWRSRYGSDPAIVGQRIPLGRQRFEVVGVTEPHAYLPGQEVVSFWAPLTMAGAFPGIDPWSEPDAASLVVVGRLRPDVDRRVGACVARRVAASAFSSDVRCGAGRRAHRLARHAHHPRRADADHVRVHHVGVRPGAPGRLRERHEPDAGARAGTTAGNRRAPGAWCQPVACGAPVDRGKPGARRSGGRDGACPHHRHGSRVSRRHPRHVSRRAWRRSRTSWCHSIPTGA